MFDFLRNNEKIFCVSYQKNGTTSVGEFFRIHGYKVAKWRVSNRNEWSMSWLNGNFDAIFESNDFKKNQVFEDDPWFLPEFYKILYNKFPKSKFILMERDSEAWFNSLLKHQKGKNLGNTQIHSKIYKREKDFYKLMQSEPYKLFDYDKNLKENWHRLEISESQKQHYIERYEIHNQEVKSFFHHFSPKSLITLKLEDKEKWQKLGAFFSIDVPQDFSVHENKTSR